MKLVEAGEACETALKSIQKSANSIHKSIQVTIGYSSNHENKRLLILDLEVWIEQIYTEGGKKCQSLHSKYMKQIGSQKVISKESALPMQTKISISVTDFVCIMRNVSEQYNKKEDQPTYNISFSACNFSL